MLGWPALTGYKFRLTLIAPVVCALPMSFPNVARAQAGPVVWWSFEDGSDNTANDVAGRHSDRIIGNTWRVRGVAGSALKCDGFTSRVVREAAAAPDLSKGFTVEAWIAVRAYPWGWCPIVSQRRDKTAGYFLGLDAEGHLSLQAALGGQWVACTTRSRLPLFEWVHVVGSSDPQAGLTLYVNGEAVQRLAATGMLTLSGDVDLQLARNHGPEPVMFENNDLPALFSFDGLLDEVKIYDRVLDEADVREAFELAQPKGAPALERARLPSGPETAPRFDAFYTHLRYTQGWDALWRSSGPDVVVAFDKAPYRFVCWRGISYAPCWVTERGNWFTNEFMERGVDRGERGCSESMSDKRAEYSHVSILENCEARKVIYWRHSPVDIYYRAPFVDRETGWGDWSEEYHTIYPDGVAVRKVIMYSSNFDDWHEWCQSIEPLHAGQRPEDVLDGERILSLANMEGQGKVYGWESGRKHYRYPSLPQANMQITYLKSKFNPFLILDDRPGRNDNGHDGPEITRVGGDGWSDYSPFPWRNHWPVTQIPIIGRHAVAADRAAHTYTSTQHSAAYATTKNSITKIMLCGMTDCQEAAELLPLARSWLRPPKLEIFPESYRGGEYDPTERVYRIHCTGAAQAALTCRIHATTQNPLRNLALIVENWGDAQVRAEVDGKFVSDGEAFRFGHRRRMSGTDLVVWLRIEREATCEVRLSLVSQR